MSRTWRFSLHSKATRDEPDWVWVACITNDDYSGHLTVSEDVALPAACPNCGELMLIMPALTVANDVVQTARLLVKAERERSQSESLRIASRADLSRVNDIINRRMNQVPVRV